MMLGIQRAGVSIAASLLQKADRPSARHFRAARVARHRRRGDRMKLAMSHFGIFLTQRDIADLSFDHLVRTGEQLGRHSEAERFRGLEINHQLNSCALLDG